MKKITLVLSIVVLLTAFAKKTEAQFYFYDNKYYDNPWLFELGGSVGAMNCLTDIGGNKGIGKKFVKDLNFGKTHPSGSVYISAGYKYAVSLRAEASFGQVSASDAVLQSVKSTTFGRYETNLSFRSNISEFMLAAEIHPLFIFIDKNNEDWTPPMLSPYLLAGIGFFHFNPQANYNGKWIDLQPLSTEGQGFAEYPDRKTYSLSQINIPVGIGVRYELNSVLNLRAEFVYRILNTDYLDDVSTNYINPIVFQNYFTGNKLNNALLLNNRQYELDPTHITQEGDQRGNPKNKDTYFSFNIKIGFIFGRENIKR